MYQNKQKKLSRPRTPSNKYTIKSTLKVNLERFKNIKNHVRWFRLPPKPHQIEQICPIFQKSQYKCSGLDYQCLIYCNIYDESTNLLEKFEFGPIQQHITNRLSTYLEFKVQVLLFNQYKNCIFSLKQTPKLTNPTNNKIYQLTSQDLNSIYVKQTSVTELQNKMNTQINKKNLLVVKNLFQRLILLKLFNSIPHGVYSYSMELLQIKFYDQISFNLALMAINRHKYSKKSQNQIIYKKQKNEEIHQKDLIIRQQVNQNKKQMINRIPIKNYLKKSPKQSINSGNQSILSINSSNGKSSRVSFLPKNHQKNNSNHQNQIKEATLQNKKIIKQPKISILSTQITTIKGQRNEKASFPDTPNNGNIIIPQIFKSRQIKNNVPIRHSQQQLKTPRMNNQLQIINQNISIKKKSCSSIQKTNEQPVQQIQYVNEFQNLLYQEKQHSSDQLCLNDSFIKLQQKEYKQTQLQSRNFDKNLTQAKLLKAESKNQSENSLNAMKEKIIFLLNENKQLQRNNQFFRKQIQKLKQKASKNLQIIKYQQQLQKMKLTERQLEKQIKEIRMKCINVNFNVIQQQNTKKIQLNRPSALYPKRQSKQLQNFFNNKHITPVRGSKEDVVFKTKVDQQYLNKNKKNDLSTKNYQQDEEARFFKFQQDKDYLKFRTNQSYSYKPINFTYFKYQKNQK